MRLINVFSFGFEDFLQGNRPKYAILSHTWGDEEVSLQQFQRLKASTKDKAGYLKIKNTCRRARERGIWYVWVDTCCIDKTSSAELSEAINSMFRWYQEAEVCFAYLADVPSAKNMSNSAFDNSRWFTRGWTLQELLAPGNLDFFASDWSLIANRTEIATQVSSITGIDDVYLSNPDQISRQKLLAMASVAERMCWASKRETSREEDIAYCLLGIFGVNMSLRYGEGKSAFLRLQEEIMRDSFDPTLFVWSVDNDEQSLFHERPKPYSPWQSALKMLLMMEHPWCGPSQDRAAGPPLGFLAPGPECFRLCKDIVACKTRLVWTPRSDGLEVTLPISQNETPYAVIPCRLRNDPWNLLAVPLEGYSLDAQLRPRAPVIIVSHTKWHLWRQQRVLLRARAPLSINTPSPQTCQVCIGNLPETLQLVGSSSLDGWNSRDKSVRVNLAIKSRTSDHDQLSAFWFQVRGSDAMFSLIFRMFRDESLYFISRVSTELEYGFVEMKSRAKLLSLLRKSPQLSSLPKDMDLVDSVVCINAAQADYLEEPVYIIDIVERSKRPGILSRYVMPHRPKSRFSFPPETTVVLNGFGGESENRHGVDFDFMVSDILLDVSQILELLGWFGLRFAVVCLVLIVTDGFGYRSISDNIKTWALDMGAMGRTILENIPGLGFWRKCWQHADAASFMYQLVPLWSCFIPRRARFLHRMQYVLALLFGSILVRLCPFIHPLVYEIAIAVRNLVEVESGRREPASFAFSLYGTCIYCYILFRCLAYLPGISWPWDLLVDASQSFMRYLRRYTLSL